MNTLWKQWLPLRRLTCVLLCMTCVLLLPWRAFAAQVFTWDGVSSPTLADQLTGFQRDNEVTVTLAAGTTVTGQLRAADVGRDGAYNNTLTISGAGSGAGSGSSSVTSLLHGVQNTGDLIDNALTITGITAHRVYGAYSTAGPAYTPSLIERTRVTLNNVEVTDFLTGVATPGLARDNHVVLNNTSVANEIIGANAGTPFSGKVHANSLTLNNSSARKATGGYGTVSATQNTLVITGTSNITENAIAGESFGLGAFADPGTASSNKLVLNGGNVGQHAKGGLAGGTVEANRVEISGGQVGAETIGGESLGGTAISNTVTLSGGTLTGFVTGGKGATSALKNEVHISGGVLQGGATGGHATGSGLVSENIVVISGNAESSSAFTGLKGGMNTGTGDVTHNRVVINDTARVMAGATGGYASGGSATHNSVQMNGGTAAGLVGAQGLILAANNIVEMNAGTVNGYVVGGSGDGSVTDNAVTISGGEVKTTPGRFLFVYGGRSHRGNTERNSVSISNVVNIEASVVGGTAMDLSTGNWVNMEGGTVTGFVTGGESIATEASGNAVKLSGGTVGGALSGGKAATEATGNAVQMTGGSVGGALTGGSAGTTATSNTVHMSGGSVTGDVRGGVGVTGTSENVLDLSGGTAKGDVYGGQNTGAGAALKNTVILADAMVAEKSVYGGHSTGGAAEENAVGLSGTVEVRGAVVGGFSQSHAANKNAVMMTGGSALSLVGGQSVAADATGNTVEITDGSVADYVAGGETDTGTAADNTVTLHGGALASALYGGYATGTGSATGNTVNIHGGVTGPALYGGYAAGTGSATGNTVNLYGSPNLSATTIYGGFAGGDARTGNTLNVFSTNLVATNVANFDNYNFILPAPVMPGDTVLNLTDTAPTLVGNAKVGVGKIGSGMLMQPGDRIYLLRNDGGGVQAEGFTPYNIRGQHGVSVEYTFQVRATDKTVEIYLDPAADPVKIRPETKALAEAYIATLALINQGAELATKSAVAAARARTEDLWGLHVFGTVAGGSARYNTGSHVDLSGTNMVAGVSKSLPVQDVSVLLGAFVEAGFARYQTNNGFSDRPSVTARGNNRYMGGGLLAHATRMVKDADGTPRPRGPYAEASVRAGRMDMDFASKDLRDASGRQATYTASAPYYGAHVGTGYVWNLSDSTTAEVYGQAHWTLLKGDKFRVIGDPVTVDDVTSWRLRGGARLSHAWNERVSGYVGAAYEHSFDGKVTARAYHLRIPSPALQGGSGLVEAGLRLTPSDNGGFSSDVNVSGSVGHKQSIGGEITMQYAF